MNNAQLNEETRLIRIEQYHTVASSVAHFSSRLTLCRTLAEYTEVLKEFYYLLHQADTLYFCLDKAWNSPAYEGREFLCSIVSETAVLDMPEYFNREILLPALWKEREKPMIFYFSPLSFQKRLFGYTVLAYQQLLCYDFSFRDWNKTIADTVEFLRMKNDIHYLTQCQKVSSLYDSLTGFYHLNEFRQIAETPEFAGKYFFQAIKLSFSADGEYLYGENYRSDIISETAGIIKQVAEKHEICCRAGEDLFLVLCKIENGRRFSERLKILLYHEFCGKFDENQVIVTYSEYSRKTDEKTVDEICHDANQIAENEMKQLLQRHEFSHYRTLLELRTKIQKSPKKAPSTKEVCRTLCISDGYFRVIYKKCFGVSYVQDCINARIMLACYLLCTTAMSIYAIALKCGYTDEKYFDRQFGQSTGYAPMQYRKQYC